MSDQPLSKENIIDIISANALGSDGFWLHIIKYLKQKAVGSRAKIMWGEEMTVFPFKFIHKHIFGWYITYCTKNMHLISCRYYNRIKKRKTSEKFRLN